MSDDGLPAAKPRRVDFAPDEFLAGTSDLSLEETGAFWKLCAKIYSRGSALPDDDQWLARVLGCDVRVWRRIKTSLLEQGKLIIAGDKLSNGRCEIELGKARGRIETARENGSKGGRASGRKAGDKGNFGDTSGELTPQVRGTSAGSSGDLFDKLEVLSHENNHLGQPDGFLSRARATTNYQQPTTNKGASAPPPNLTAAHVSSTMVAAVPLPRDADAIELIKLFDKALDEHFGSSGKRSRQDPSDPAAAEQILALGFEQCQLIWMIDGECRKRADEGLEPPRKLKFFLPQARRTAAELKKLQERFQNEPMRGAS